MRSQFHLHWQIAAEKRCGDFTRPPRHVKNRNNLRPLRRPRLIFNWQRGRFTTHDSTGRVWKMPPYSTPSPKTLQRTKDGRKTTKCDLHPNPLQSGTDLPEVLCLLMAYLSMPSAARLIRRFVRSQGVPETRCGPARGLWEIWTGVKTKKKRLRQQLWVWHPGLDHTDHRGHSHENVLLSVSLINAT